MAWSSVQSGEADRNDTSLTLSLTLTGVASGNLLVAVAATLLSGRTFTFSDDKSNSWNTVQTANGSGGSCVLAYVDGAASGDTSITVTRSSADAGFLYLAVAEYSGQATSPLDQSAKSSGFGSTPSSGSITTTEDDTLVIGVIGAENATRTLTPDSDLTVIQQLGTTNAWMLRNSTLGVPTGSYDINGVLSGNSNWNAIVASFKMAAGGGGGSEEDGFYYYRMMQG